MTGEAIKWYEKAAESGVEIAYVNLAAHYQMGIGVLKDESKAVSIYLKGANSGFPWLRNALGMCYKKRYRS